MSNKVDLKGLATEISKVYIQNKKVEAVLLGGSVSRNWCDEYSDIELFVFWKEKPTNVDRKASIYTVDGTIIDFHPYEDEEWSESYVTQGVKLEISNFLTVTIEKVIDDVVVNLDTDLDKQCLVATIHDGIALEGEERVHLLKEKVKEYPKKLGEAMIKDNIHLGNRWNNREALVAREDWLMLYKVITTVQTNIMGMLFGLNKLYVHHPAFKWQKQSIQAMGIVPNHFLDRFEAILLEHPKEALSELELLTLEVYQLIERNCPNVDVSHIMEKSFFLRP